MPFVKVNNIISETAFILKVASLMLLIGVFILIKSSPTSTIAQTTVKSDKVLSEKHNAITLYTKIHQASLK